MTSFQKDFLRLEALYVQLNIIQHQTRRIQHHAPVPKHIHRYPASGENHVEEKSTTQFWFKCHNSGYLASVQSSVLLHPLLSAWQCKAAAQSMGDSGTVRKQLLELYKFLHFFLLLSNCGNSDYHKWLLPRECWKPSPANMILYIMIWFYIA